jgi:hypothetical protein
MSTTFTGRNIANFGGMNWLKEGVVHTVDPKKALLDAIGNIESEAPDLVQFSRILVAIYRRPKIEKVGNVLMPIQRTEAEQHEDIYQGKVGLIIAMGKLCYQDDENTKFHGVKNNVGDWVWFSPQTGTQCAIGGGLIPCRIFTEAQIFGRLPDPDYVW